jgi:acyl-CoA synthetase (AMP-forming)/AMP-acid ligase II
VPTSPQRGPGRPRSDRADNAAGDHPRTIPDWLAAIASEHADRTAVVGPGGSLTFRELEIESRRWGEGLLRRGVSKGCRVGLWLGNGPEWMLAWAAVSRIGAVAVPLSTFFSDRELGRVVRHADLHGLICHQRFLNQDITARLEHALPSLARAHRAFLALPEAPYLRWIVSMKREDDPRRAAPEWMRPVAWVTQPADDARAGEWLLEQVESEVHPADPALMIYTSGSTADPKGVPHVHETVTFKTRYLRDFFGVGPETRSYIASPFFWVGGMTMSLFPVLDAGGTQYCTDRFEAGDVLALIEREHIDRAVLYPHHVSAILAHPDFERRDRSSLRDADPRLLVGKAAESTPDPDKLYIGPGMTETFDGYWWGRRTPGVEAPLRPGERRPPPLDVLLPGMEMKVVDPSGALVADGERGEICLRGPGVTSGLHKAPRAAVFDADGFFHTGDQVQVDGSRVWFRGRLSEMIKTSGANVAPEEVVNALREIDGVAEAHVVGLPDDDRGQVVAAAVIMRPGSPLDAESIRGRLRQVLSPFKVPVHIVFLTEEEVPWTPSHKVPQGVLADLIRQRSTA